MTKGMGVEQKVLGSSRAVMSPVPGRHTSGSRLLQNMDWLTVLLYFLLVALGWMNIYAAVYSPDNVVNIMSFDINSGKQLVWIAASLLLIVVLLVVDYKEYEHLAYPI